MSHRVLVAFASAALSLAFALHARAGIVYDEAVSGDLSNDGLAPTLVTIGAGSNEVFGTTGRTTEFGTDRDYFTVNVPIGHQLVALIENAGTTTLGAVSFLGIQSGTQVTVLPTASDATGLLGWVHFQGAASDTDILPALGASGFGATGFVPPLPAGDYAFWIQETRLGASSYGFDLVVAVPEPTTAAALLVGLLAFGFVRGRPKHA